MSAQRIKVQIDLDPPDPLEEMRIAVKVCAFLKREGECGGDPLLMATDNIDDSLWRAEVSE